MHIYELLFSKDLFVLPTLTLREKNKLLVSLQVNTRRDFFCENALQKYGYTVTGSQMYHNYRLPYHHCPVQDKLVLKCCSDQLALFD